MEGYRSRRAAVIVVGFLACAAFGCSAPRPDILTFHLVDLRIETRPGWGYVNRLRPGQWFRVKASFWQDLHYRYVGGTDLRFEFKGPKLYLRRDADPP